jgi:hypothetical protein
VKQEAKMATDKIDSPHKRIERAERALEKIHTWASFDIKKKASVPRALQPKDVADLCRKTLEEIAGQTTGSNHAT